MTTILGIDAAWTVSNPSGVAVIGGGPGRWRLLATAGSYGEFCGWNASGHLPQAKDLISRTEKIAGAVPLVVAVDMPLSHRPIVGRRRSDDEISRVYGGRHCSTHSPSALRPGSVGEALQRGLEAEGFELATTQLRGRSLVEVYPHPALVELTGAPRRLPYKVGKLRSYWPNHSPSQRREALLAAWREIVAALETKVAGVAGDLQMPLADAPIRTLKSVEDRLDAVVCAWVGACIFEGRALAHGDAESAIWTLIGAA